MIIVICLSILAILGMFICILKVPSIKIKTIQIDTFYIPIMLVAIIFLVFPLFNKDELFNILFSNSNMNPLKILILFISISLISIALDETRFFDYIASIFINKYNSSQTKLFVFLYILISILTVFTSNDIVILTFTPFILYFSKSGKINPIPYLVMEFVAANTYSMMFSIGNPTNIYLASMFEITFLDYFLTMIIPTLFCGISSILILFLLFRKDLKKQIEVFEINECKIRNKPLCITCLIHLCLATILLAISSYIHIEMWIICLSLAISLLIIIITYSIIKKNKYFIKSTLKRIPYSLIPFILSMFTIIMALNSYDVFNNIYIFLRRISTSTTEPIIYLLTSTISCNIVNNIPMTLAFGSILSNCENINLVYATIIGSNIGAILTPVGALAGIMWLRILKLNNVDYSFKSFIKNGMIITIVLLIAAAISLLII